jgi:hypothetical protein
MGEKIVESHYLEINGILRNFKLGFIYKEFSVFGLNNLSLW